MIKKNEKLSKEEYIDLYAKMYMIRIFEEKLLSLFEQGLIGGTLHLCCGQEAVAAGVCSQLFVEDAVFSNHRGHGHILAKGADLLRVLAEILGKKEGYCQGKGGTQHISARHIGFMGTNGITGGGLPIATGAAMALKILNRPHVVVCFFGDGASSQGTFHESLNMASLWNLPILYVCENNQYAMSNPVKNFMSSGSVARMSEGYNIHSIKTDGMDIDNVVSSTRGMLQYVREKKRPALIEFDCYRFVGHSRSDTMVYRTREEEQQWKQRDPIDIVQNKSLMKDEDFETVHETIRARLEFLVNQAKDLTFGTMEDALQGVYNNS